MAPLKQAVPMLVGIYGVSGCGKSTILAKLAESPGEATYTLIEGSEVIAKITPGGLDQFKRLEASEQGRIRGDAIISIKQDAVENGRPAIVAGHFSFWNREQGNLNEVITAEDLKSYTHIICLNPDAETVVEQCQNDQTRSRETLTVEEVRKWQTQELQRLRTTTQEHSILLAVVRPGGDSAAFIRELLRDFALHNVNHNRARAEAALDVALDAEACRHTLVLDADKTIAPQDAGALYWSKVKTMFPNSVPKSDVSDIFSGPLAYSYGAFRQAMLRYEETACLVDFDSLCREISRTIQPYEQMLDLLRALCSKEVNIVVITCGVKHVWEMVLKTFGLSDNIKVLGGCRLQDGYVMTQELKGQLVGRLKEHHGQRVAVIGDSPVDIKMLEQADFPVILAGDEGIRSRSMPRVVADAIENAELKAARQVLLPATTKPLLESSVLPITTLSDVVACLTDYVPGPQGVPPQNVLPQDHTWVHHLTETDAAKILASPMRDSEKSGPDLCGAHETAGQYLATNLLTNIIGLQEFEMRHVQTGKTTLGYSLKDENKTTIVALMRGGEPMARGVYKVFPRAMFKHVNTPDQLAHHHVAGQSTIIFVDSVINSGKSIVDMVHKARQLCSEIRIVIVAGVVQKGCLSGDGLLALMHAREPGITLAALRLSENKFKGSGTTDTGNRLFNTTHID